LYLAEKQGEQQQLVEALRRFPDINHRQRDLLNQALRHPAEVHTFTSHQNSHNITYVTARADLLGLLKRGLLTEVKEGKQRGFIASETLAEKLGCKDSGKKRAKR